ncbi:DinB family protein [Frankia sp. Mgl5]|nr:DUF664 domain-containing protein [Frankia sp. Mgl5]MCK9931207.1 DinB family protein [Frankia sp. Mgl5]
MADEPEPPARARLTYLQDERELLDGWLEFHRSTLLTKCDGLSDDLRRARPVATSPLSLHGLVCHLAETERNWFSRILEAKPGLGRIWYDPAVEGSPHPGVRPAQRPRGHDPRAPRRHRRSSTISGSRLW